MRKEAQRIVPRSNSEVAAINFTAGTDGASKRTGEAWRKYAK